MLASICARADVNAVEPLGEVAAMAQRSLSMIMLVFALLGIADGWRLEASERGQSLFDDIGPDRYLMGLGVLLAVLSLCLLLQRQQSSQRTEDAGVEQAATADGATIAPGLLARIPAHGLAVAALAFYAATLPWLGYVVSTLLFMIAAFRVAGVRGWLKSAAFGVAATGLAYWIFVRASDVPLPSGWLSRLIG
jgi:hypothetical protein